LGLVLLLAPQSHFDLGGGGIQAQNPGDCVKVLMQNAHGFLQLVDTLVFDFCGLFEPSQFIYDRSQLDLGEFLVQLFGFQAGARDVNVRHVATEFPSVPIAQLLTP
jgi:hypothetical protein